MAEAPRNAQSDVGKFGLFWSGDLGQAAAELCEKMLSTIFGHGRAFISTKMEPGPKWYDKLRTEIAASQFGLFFVTPDSLESRWLPFECGQYLSHRDLDTLIPVRVGVSQKLMDARLPMLNVHHANEFGTLETFEVLCRACARKLGSALTDEQLLAMVGGAWSAHRMDIDLLLSRARAYLPDTYDGVMRYSKQIGASNFKMPEVFALFQEELFMVGINHAYVLNIEREKRIMTALIDRLLAGNGKLRARFMISDMWNKEVFTCYQNLVPAIFAQSELDSFTRIYAPSTGTSAMDVFLEQKYGADGLRHIVRNDLLEIRTFPTILDTFWFVDGSRCQLSLANANDGPSRPFMYCGKGKDDASEVFDYYHGLANTAFAQGKRVWPR